MPPKTKTERQRLNTLLAATQELAAQCAALKFDDPVTHAYHSLQYAWAAHEQYLRRYAPVRACRVIYLGMNPGPFGMAQTGIPFGDVVSARDYLGISADIAPPANQHPKRPVQGFACPRVEVSGSRLWQFFAQRHGAASEFFQDQFVLNYCPVLFLRASGANLTPDKLKGESIATLTNHCDTYLRQAVQLLQPQYLIGIGAFAEKRLITLFDKADNHTIGKILHPSPASPAANRDFPNTATQQLNAILNN